MTNARVAQQPQKVIKQLTSANQFNGGATDTATRSKGTIKVSLARSTESWRMAAATLPGNPQMSAP